MDYEIGQRIADYEVVGLVGVGGMGRVYRVRNAISHRTEAMKVLLADLSADRELGARFLSEIRTLATLDHPHIAQLHTAMQVGNELVMMMEFVDGCTLQELAQQAPLVHGQIVDYMHQVLGALSFAHSRGVIHRDIKPANIMVTATGKVKLTDFGIAKSRLKDELTRPGTTVGSLSYMSPEQAKGGCTIDGRADLYSLGITMYELLAGRRPFEDESAHVVLHRQLNAEPCPPVEINPLISRPLNDLIMRALEKDPQKRFQDAAAFSNALSKATGIAASTPVRSYPAFGSANDAGPEPAANGRILTALKSRERIVALAGLVAAVVVAAALSVPHFMAAGAPVRAMELSISQPSLSSSAAADQAPMIQGSEAAAPALSAVQLVAHNADIAPAMPPPTPVAPTPGRRERSAKQRQGRADYASLRDDETSPASEGGSAPAQGTVPPPAELQQLRDQAMVLDARAVSLRLTVQRLKNEREAAGDGLNQDVADAYVRMNAYLYAEKIDLQDGDAAAARDHLEKAKSEESALSKLFNQ